jgi:crotonobetainyl-CoA:carnitine CoA-transferase CaiB-like acyl-CoA transferase
LRVVEWSETLPAAYCTRILADLGAEVIKLERPRSGDPLRHAGPLLPGMPYGEDSALFAYANHGKRSVTLDPSKPSGMALLRRLLEQSHVLVESQAAPTLAGLDVSAVNPALVMLSVTPMGHGVDGFAATDLSLTHHAAYAFHQARPVQSPDEQPPIAGADHEIALAAGVAAATGALSAVLMAEQSGVGQHLDCAESDVIAHLLIEPVADYGRGERQFSRLRENLSGTEVAGGLIWLLPCIDGFVMISPREQHQWDRWMALIGSPSWAEDATLCGSRDARTKNWMVLQSEMSSWTTQRTREDVFTRAQAARVACFPVSRPRDLLENTQFQARGFFDRLSMADGSGLAMPGLPFVLRDSAGAALPRGRDVRVPTLGEANVDILQTRLGLSADDLEPLRRHGVV